MSRSRASQLSASRIAHYHCLSRVVDRNFVFGDHEREVFRKILRQVEAFTGVRVITWTILSNHFHLLLEVSARPERRLSVAEILTRCRALYSADWMVEVEDEFAEAARLGEGALEAVREKYLKRMWDLSEFMKTLKQKFTGWFNRKHSREGTLWERRFKSVLVEGRWKCLMRVAAYIDLNAVRAGIVADPKDYRWCGYGEAVAGERLAQEGLAIALTESGAVEAWREVGPRYRKVLFGEGGETASRAGLEPAEIAKVFAAGGELSQAQLLRCRVRYFSDGLVIGSEAFVEEFFQSKRSTFSAGRTTGARKLRGGDWGELRSARALVVRAISPGGGDG